MIDFKSLNLTEIENLMTQLKVPKFRAIQIFKWLQSGINSYKEMSNIPLDLRERLAKDYNIVTTNIHLKLASKVDNTVKYLYKLFDGEIIESVVMNYHHGNSICISTQVGCSMGCDFCASTKNGLVRNLQVGEMLSQITTAEHDLGIKISNVVLMGIGEPLDNYDNVIKFLELVTHENGLNMAARHISVSTCGLVDRIRQMADLQLQCTLSISLHAPNDLLRSSLMPINKKYNIEQLISACWYYIDKTHRRISFEYVLIDNVNDSLTQAIELKKLLKGKQVHVNLIPVNTISEKNYLATKAQKAEAFMNYLNDNGINTTIRRTLGSDISASCGQLRADSSKNV